ncbi:MAG TPA: thioredoxin family protein [Nitrospiria bacterium]|nr:thioredoxin family protein [Nitrospiria bacterium]
MAGALPRVSDENYQDYLDAGASVVLFKIANCQKCEEFMPILAEAGDRYNGNVRFGMALLHVPGACRAIKRKYRFESFPTTHFYRAGELVHTEEQKLPAEELDRLIREHLLG